MSYTPLFLYVLYPFYLVGGGSFASVPIFLADAATAAVIYLIVERSAGERLGLAAGLTYALSPFALYYEGYAWFSSQPMTFFLILGTYYLLRDKPVESLTALAIGILFKQQAVFLLPIYVGWFVHKHSARLLAGLSAFSAIVVAASLPFLIISPRDYLSLVSYGILGKYPGAVAYEPVTSSAICHNVSGNLVGTTLSCTFGSSTFYQFVTSPGPTTVLLNRISYNLDVLSGIVAIPLVLLLIPVLYSLRRNPQFLALVYTYSGAAFLVIFSLVFHPALKYYYVPVYALLLTTVASKKSLAVAAAAPILSLVTPSGAFQELLPVLAILAVAITLDSNTREVDARNPLANN